MRINSEVKRGRRMQSLQSAGRRGWTKVSVNRDGLAGWLLELLRGLRSERQATIRQMHLLETLSLGGKRQLMLVECAGECFLVGGGIESVQTIVRVRAEATQDGANKVGGAGH